MVSKHVAGKSGIEIEEEIKITIGDTRYLLIENHEVVPCVRGLQS